MKLIIDIPEWKYKSICEGIEASKRCGVVGIDPDIYEAIYNGTPLPKGHGRLVDENYIIAELIYRKHLLSDGVKCGQVTEIFNRAVVIDADMESNNETDN